MRTPVKLAAYGGALVLAFGAALVSGAIIGSPGNAADNDHAESGGGGGGHGDAIPTAAAAYGGLTVSEAGYTLRLNDSTLSAGADIPLAFEILGANGEPVRSYQESHTEDLHLIAVRRDATGFQHVHPELAADGTWSVALDLTAGSWRIFADFVALGMDGESDPMTLGADLHVAGDFQPVALPEPSSTAEIDGYTVTLDGELAPEVKSELTLSVTYQGRPVTDLQPYLAAYGHLVALRDGDRAYLHVHPAGSPGDGVTQPGPAITFYATAPSIGDYRLFLDFKHDDSVHTAEFTATAEDTKRASPDEREEESPVATHGNEHGGAGH